MGEMAWRMLFIVSLISTLVAAKPLDVETYGSSEDDRAAAYEAGCPAECTCSIGALSDLVVQCRKYQQLSPLQSLPRISNKMEGFVTRLDIEGLRMPVLSENFLNADGSYGTSLNSLRLSNSSVNTISSMAFESAKKLEELELSHNALTRIPNQVFHSLSSLRQLSLNNNQRLNFPQHGSFLKSNSLEEIDLSNCGVTEIRANSLSRLPKLTYLNLANNKLTNIDPHALARLNYLEELDLSGNDLINLPSQLPSSLKTLNLRNNPNFNVSTLIDLSKDLVITELDISGCNIEQIPRDLFRRLNDLTSLNISNNLIKNLYFPFVLRQLEYLDLSNNKIQGTLDSNLLGSCSKLETLRLGWNNGLKLPENGLSGDLKSLYLLDLAGCGLDIIPPTSIQSLTSLARLNLSNNALETLDPNLFTPFKSLSILDLSYNALNFIPETIFNNNRIKHLSVASNPNLAPVFNHKIIQNQQLLNTLNLANCEFIQTPENLPGGLETLIISGNKLRDPTRLNELIEQSLFLLHNIGITDNPWKCNFEFKQFIGTLRARQIFDEGFNSSWSDYQADVCFTDRLSNQMISEANFVKPDIIRSHFWSLLTFALTLMIFMIIAFGVKLVCKGRVKGNLNRNYKHLSESTSNCTPSPTPHVPNKIYKETTIPIVKSEDDTIQPTTFTTSFLFPRFPVTESEIPTSYVSGNYHHGELVP